jgi:hypothetical protein
VDDIDGEPDGSVAQLEAGLLRIVREYRAGMGMAQLFVVGCEEELN